MTTRVYLAYDDRMGLHKSLPGAVVDCNVEDGTDEIPPENPGRTSAIFRKLMELEEDDAFSRFIHIPCIPAARETIELCHSTEHYDRMEATMDMSDDELRQMTVPNDLYFNKHTFTAAKLAVGGVVECVNAVTQQNKRSNRAIALVRPPGHHALRDEPMGKCLLVSMLERTRES
jgi:histone deacetylase 6